MRNKPKEEWHNFDFESEKRLGELDVAISLNAMVARRFLEHLQDRVRRNTGIRFKFRAQAAQEVVTKKDRQYLSYQLFTQSEVPYVFPNKSNHNDKYESRYSRIEFYIPIERLGTRSEDKPVQMVLEF